MLSSSSSSSLRVDGRRRHDHRHHNHHYNNSGTEPLHRAQKKRHYRDGSNPTSAPLFQDSNSTSDFERNKLTSEYRNDNNKQRNRMHQHEQQSQADRIDTLLPPSTQEILSKINQITCNILSNLNNEIDPTITIHIPKSNSSTAITTTTKSINNLSTCRSYTSTLLILSIVQQLLLCRKSTTIREIYYSHVTHFRNQRECDSIINDVCNLLSVERAQLGLYASPKGWFCGSIVITEYGNEGDHEDNNDKYGVSTSRSKAQQRDRSRSSTICRVIDGTSSSSNQGIPITREWIIRSSNDKKKAEDSLQQQVQSSQEYHEELQEHDAPQHQHHHAQEVERKNKNNYYKIKTSAKCILVIEKEGIFLRLSEDRFFDRYPCIIVTGKGYPDIATRAFVHILHQHYPHLPIYGLCDCNPYGVSILQTYFKGSEKRFYDGGERYSVPIQWIGLRPSFVEQLKENHGVETGNGNNLSLPKEVFQKLTLLDKKKIEKLCHETNVFIHGDFNDDYEKYPNNDSDEINIRLDELELMSELGYKVELESLNWLGMDYITNWLFNVLVANCQYREMRRRHKKEIMVHNENDQISIDHGNDHNDDRSYDIDIRIAC